MIEKIKAFLGLGDEDPGSNQEKSTPQSPLHMAAAALLVHVAMSHDGFSTEEKDTILEALQTHYNLSADKAESILERATTFEKNALDLHSFTRVINMHLEQEGRQDIVRILWIVAYADNDLDENEANTIAKIADLLGVSTRDRVRLKQSVEAETQS